MEEKKPKPTILIVDDDLDSREGIRALLEIKSLSVVEAQNAEEALKLAKKIKPGLVILDIMMETKNAGFDAVYQMRKDPELRAIPVILLSNLPNLTDYQINPEIEERYLPVERFLAKPINPELLYQEIERILGIKL